MGVTDTRRLARNPQVVRRRRLCEKCGLSFQTEERPRLHIARNGQEEPFLRGVLLASLRRAAEDCDPPVPDTILREAIRRVVVGILADAPKRPSAEEVVERTGSALRELDLERVAIRYDPAFNPYSFEIQKRDGSVDAFSREKLKQSVAAAAVKFVENKRVEAIVDVVEEHFGGTSGAATTAQIRELVGGILRQHDERAFLSYELGGPSPAESLDAFLDRVSPTAGVIKRDGSVVLFSAAKLAKSIRRSFVSERRNAYTREIDNFVASQERLVREMSTEHEPETTGNLGQRVSEWLFDLDELAWANYWLAFASDHELVPGGSPIQQLAKKQLEMRRSRELRALGTEHAAPS